MFLLRSSLLSHLCRRNGGIKRLVTNCTPSCPKLKTSITRDAEIEKMKLLSIAFEYVIRVEHIHSEWKIDLIPRYVISVKGITI